MIEFLLIALAISGVSFTITVTSIFKWLRELVSPIHQKLEELIHCPWCLSHWIAFMVFLKMDLIQFCDSLLWNYFLTVFSAITVSGLSHFALLRAYEPVAKMMVERMIMKKRNEKV